MSAPALELKLAWSDRLDAMAGARRTPDPLGFRAVADRIAPVLVPGLTGRTAFARGFSLLCLGLEVAREASQVNQDPPVEVDDAYLRFERLWVLSQTKGHGRGDPFPGQRAAARLLALPVEPRLQATGTAVRLTLPLLQPPELGAGGWGMYGKASRDFDLIGRRSAVGAGSTSPASMELRRGRQLAKAVRAELNLPPGLARDVLNGAARVGMFERLKAADARPGREERALLGAAIRDFDAHHDGALGCLSACFWSVNRRPTVASLPQDALAPTQRGALRAARALLHLMRRIERPYRLWVAGEDPGVYQPPTPGHWDEVLSGRWDRNGDLGRLREALARPGRHPWVKVHDHHLYLAAQRRSVPWQRHEATWAELRYKPPEFTLPAAWSLFRGDEVDPG